MDKSAISSTIGLARKNSSTIGLAKFSLRLCVDKDQKVQELRSLNSRTGMCLSQNQLFCSDFCLHSWTQTESKVSDRLRVHPNPPPAWNLNSARQSRLHWTALWSWIGRKVAICQELWFAELQSGMGYKFAATGRRPRARQGELTCKIFACL